MSFNFTFFSILVLGILAVSLLYTWYLTRQQKVVEGELDSKIEKPVQQHAYLRNPIFLSYGVFFALVLLIILFVAFNIFR
ncbi:hypothetical protein RCG23_05230 [Neobacillus sp. PS3-34]|uniref:hypothetical protein n=1 Tax=Neobacillus sp. PS3-34 TaxID=3070678 RepID=UPI0027E0F6C1|nr:hypothetical protein [Neobacillus sp. PS3-34]WML49423.1 hypothetical protein RCG23_05230 [Neobacillus sp. PS3-34]